MTTSFLHLPTAARMFTLSRELVRRSLDAGRIDVASGCVAVLYIRRLERELADGVIDGDAATREAARVARTACLTRPDQRRERRPEPVPAPRPLPTHADVIVREPGGPWRRPAMPGEACRG